MNPAQPPYLGAAYYPEDWPLEQIDDDIALMKEAGMNVMRIAEFAWSRMEPHEGEYDFDWLHLVVDKLAEAGIATIMGTPTCTPPVWLAERYPECIVMNEQGTRIQHGARRHACPTNTVYREHCARIVTRMAEEFGQDDRVIGWQIDNELYPTGRSRGCSCPSCVTGFREALRKRYGTIDALNEAWCTNLWSQTYETFEQIAYPRSDVWHHPSLVLAWLDFVSDAYVAFSDAQADILHALTSQPVGTDMMPVFGVNWHKIHRKLDLVQFNHYHGMNNLWEAAFWMDVCRPLKEAPFWNTETATCWNGGITANGYKEPGFCRANSWLPIAQGGEANLYWLWRQHWAGQELMHGAVVSSCGRPQHTFGEVQEIAQGLGAAGEFLNATRPTPSGLALHMSCWAGLLFSTQPMVNGFDYGRKLLDLFYRPLMQGQFRPDVVDPAEALTEYRVMVSPFLPSLEEAGLRDRLKAWIEAGGTWIVGPMADCRTLDGTKYTRAPFGSLEDWAGIRCSIQIPGDPRDFAFRWTPGAPCSGESAGRVWYDGFEPLGAEAWALYTEGPLEGLAAVTRTPFGQGQIIVLGTTPSPTGLRELVAAVGQPCGVSPAVQASENVLVVPRSGGGRQGFVAVELGNEPGTVVLPRTGSELLSGTDCSGTLSLPAYGVAVVEG